MTTAYTSLLGLALPVEGELDGVWGDVVNDSITQLIEDSVANFATADVTSGDWTLTTSGYGVPNQARCAILIATGTPGTTRNIIAPKKSKSYIVVNQTNSTVFIKGSDTTGVSILSGKQSLVVWSGSDFVQASASAGGSNTQVQYNSSGNLAGSSNLTFNGTTLTANTLALTNALTAANGGTGLTSAGTSGNVLTSTGTGWSSAALPESPLAAGGALLVNNDEVTESYVLPTGKNALSVGPITILSGYQITVSDNQRWIVI